MLQVVSFNIGGARRMRPAPHSHDKLAADVCSVLQQIIKPAQPTLIALQETGLAVVDGDRKDVGQKIARGLGAAYRNAFAAEVTMRRHPHPKLWNRPVYQGMTQAAEGNAILTNLPPAAWPQGSYQAESSPAMSSLWARHTTISRATLYSSGNRDTQPRSLIVASLNYRGIPFYFLNTHLGVLTDEDRHDLTNARSQAASQMRQAQVSEILHVIEELKQADQAKGKPERAVLLAGDLNASPDTPEMKMLQGYFRLLMPANGRGERWTHQKHRILIDHLLLHDPAGQFAVISCHIQSRLPFNDLSDHCPIIGILDQA